MPSFKIEKILDAPKAAVWEKLSDFGNVHIFHPMVEKSELTEGSAQCGLGAKRRCTFYNGKGHVDEEVTGWNEGQSMTVVMHDGTMPVKTAAIKFDVEDAGSNRTRLTLNGEFEMKWGIVGKIMGPIMMKPVMKQMLGQVLNGLEQHIKTGQCIGPNGKLESIGSS